MADAKKFTMTQAGYDALVAELNDLRNNKRAEVAEEIREAKSHGDLSENAEYSAAREKQSFMEGRIEELTYQIEHADIQDSSSIADDEIGLGSTVRICFEGDDEAEEYKLIGSTEASKAGIDENVISDESPIGKALMGRRSGETVTYDAPIGSVKVKIVSVTHN